MNEGAPYRVAEPYGLEKCPHCGGLTAAEAHADLRWVCAACGKPVIPSLDAARLDEPALGALREAGRALHRDALKHVAIVTSLAGALVAIYVGLAVARSSLILAIAFLPTVIPIAVTQFGALRRKRMALARGHADEAWQHAVAQLARSRPAGVGAREIATALRISVADAESLLTRLSVDRGRVDIGEDQEMRYRVDAGEPLSSEAAADGANDGADADAANAAKRSST